MLQRDRAQKIPAPPPSEGPPCRSSSLARSLRRLRLFPFAVRFARSDCSAVVRASVALTWSANVRSRWLEGLPIYRSCLQRGQRATSLTRKSGGVVGRSMTRANFVRVRGSACRQCGRNRVAWAAAIGAWPGTSLFALVLPQRTRLSNAKRIKSRRQLRGGIVMSATPRPPPQRDGSDAAAPG